MDQSLLLVKPSEDPNYVLVRKDLAFQLMPGPDSLMLESDSQRKCPSYCLNQGAVGLLRWVEAWNLAVKPPKK